MAQSGRNTEMAAGMSMSNSMSSSTVSGGQQVVSENMYEGTSSASKMGADKSGFKFPSWSPPSQAPSKPTFTGRLGNFGFRGGGGGGMLAASRLNR
jgi:hypothetical protein